jgi:V/A-type H+-transporting ATPase subunit F
VATAAPRLVVVVRPDVALGFRLAGVPVVEAAVGEEARVLREALQASSNGVVAADQDVLGAIPEGDRSRAAVPLVLPFTYPRRWTEGGGGRAWVAALVRRAIGYHVKLGDTS